MKTWTLEQISDGEPVRTYRQPTGWAPPEKFLTEQAAKGRQFTITVPPVAQPEDTETHTFQLADEPTATPVEVGSAQYLTLQREWVAVEKPEVSPVPDWPGFRADLAVSDEWDRISDDARVKDVTMLVYLMGNVGEHPEVMLEIAQCWAQIATVTQPTEAEIAALNTICELNHMVFRLDDESGLFELI